MFDFEKLIVYSKAKDQYESSIKILKENPAIEKNLQHQLKRASSSVILNIAEGSGRFSKADKRYFYIMARGSVYECVAILDLLREEKLVNSYQFERNYSSLEELSKMLLALINFQTK